jgi:ferritin-like metal-binding protein YciE
MEIESTQSARNSKLKPFFVLQLQDIYWAEKKLVKKLHQLSEVTTTHRLRKA